MGYSARYHATSLIAVFLALAIGIVIGAALGGDAIDDTRRDLERSLTGNLEDARERADQLSGELARANEFGDSVYPALVRGELRGVRVGVVALGGYPYDVADGIEEALAPTGARLVGVGVVREPVDFASLAEDLSKTRFADLAENPDSQTALGIGVGRQLVLGGALLERVRSRLFSRASGDFGRLGAVILVRDQPQDMGPLQRAATGRLEAGLAEGIAATRVPAVGVETTDAEPSSISFFQSTELSSVDDVDLIAGHVATVFALLGAEGSFGVKGSADRLLPDLLAPRRP
ncbi:MAG TPA: copper transporter [Solirubrobacterales bacterium]|nr:copper transporter [Solirubrobacterales bacterium]